MVAMILKLAIPVAVLGTLTLINVSQIEMLVAKANKVGSLYTCLGAGIEDPADCQPETIQEAKEHVKNVLDSVQEYPIKESINEEGCVESIRIDDEGKMLQITTCMYYPEEGV